MARRAQPQQQQVAAAAMLVALVVVVCAGTAPATVSGAVTCAQVARDLTPCISYATGGASAPGQDCCAGIKSLNAAAAAGTAADRQATCACLKQAIASMGALKPDLVAGIPGMCGVSIPYSISSTTDCSKVRVQ